MRTPAAFPRSPFVPRTAQPPYSHVQNSTAAELDRIGLTALSTMLDVELYRSTDLGDDPSDKEPPYLTSDPPSEDNDPDDPENMSGKKQKKKKKSRRHERSCSRAMNWYHRLQLAPHFLSQVKDQISGSTAESFLYMGTGHRLVRRSSRPPASSATRLRASQAARGSKPMLQHCIRRHCRAAHTNGGPAKGTRFRSSNQLMDTSVG